MSNIKRRSFLVGAAALPIASVSVPSAALASYGNVVHTGPKWDVDLFYVKMLHQSFDQMESQRLHLAKVMEGDSFEPNSIPRNILYIGKDGENTYCIMRDGGYSLYAPGNRKPRLPLAAMYGSHIIVGMNDGKVYKDRLGGMNKPRKILPFPNMERV